MPTFEIEEGLWNAHLLNSSNQSLDMLTEKTLAEPNTYTENYR